MANRGFCSKDEAFGILRPHFSELWTGWQGALAFTQAVSAIFPFPGRRNPTTRAQQMNEFMCRFAEKYLGGQEGIAVVVSENVTMLDFQGKLLMRFKKLDDSRQASNIETGHQLLLFSQGVQFLPGMPDKATVVIAGYQLDEAGGRVEDVIVTCPRELDGGNHWDFSVPKDGGEAGMPATIAPLPAITPPKVRVRGRKIDRST